MTDLEQWTSWYAANGLTFFPLFGITNGACRCPEGANCKNIGKHPRVKWKDKPSQMPGPLDNVGISTDPLIVIDLDDGERSLRDFPPTFTTGTEHGFHLWYAASPDKQVKSMVGWKPKVDTRAIGGLLVVPPSRRVGGSFYRHVSGSTIEPIPERLLAELPERHTYQRRVGHAVELTLGATPEVMRPLVDELVQRMHRWQDGRNKTLFTIACRYFELVANNLVGADGLEALYTAAVEEGLTHDEISRTIESARNSV